MKHGERLPQNESQLTEVIVRALQRELRARCELRPHALLAISPDAPLDVIEAAYRRLSAQYDPAAFAEHGTEAVALARSIAELVRTAYETIRTERASSDSDAARRRIRDEAEQHRRGILSRIFDRIMNGASASAFSRSAGGGKRVA